MTFSFTVVILDEAQLMLKISKSEISIGRYNLVEQWLTRVEYDCLVVSLSGCNTRLGTPDSIY